MRRRQFLGFCSATVCGLWLPGCGLVELTKKMVVALTGECSFCGKDASSVRGLAGVLGTPPRICNECLGLCMDIIAYDPSSPSRLPEDGAVDPASFAALPDEEAIPALLAALKLSESEGFIEAVRHILAGQRELPPPRPNHYENLSCSFCAKSQRDVQKLIAGPTVYICDECATGGAALFSSVLRAG